MIDLLSGAAWAFVIVAAFTLGAAALGYCVIRPIWPTARLFSLHLAGGLATWGVVSWYDMAVFGSSKDCLILFPWVSAAAAIWVGWQEFRAYRARGRDLAPLLSGLKSLTAPAIMIALVALAFGSLSSTGAIRLWSLGNNDLYFWSLIADAQHDDVTKIFGLGPGYWGEWRKDASATFITLTMFESLTQTRALMATPYFVIAQLSWLALPIYELCAKLLVRRPVASAAIAVATVTAPFYFYLAFCSFFAQFIGTFAALVIVAVLVLEPLSERFNRSWLLVTVPVLLLLLGYQSGFPPMMMFAAVTAGAIAFCDVRGAAIAQRILRAITRVGLPMAAATLISFAIVPQVTIYLVIRVIYVASVNAGWPLPLINPLYLMDAPFLPTFPAPGGALWQYVVALIGVAAGAAGFYGFGDKDKPGERALSGLLLAFGAFVLLYLIGYKLVGERYQNWKLLSFTALPLSFVPLTALFLALDKVVQKLAIAPARLRALALPSLAIVLMVVGLASWKPKGQAMRDFTAFAENMADIAPQLRGAPAVVLDVEAWGETMIAMHELRFDGLIVPLHDSYLGIAPATDPVFKTQGIKVLRDAACSTLARGVVAGERPPSGEGVDEHRYVIAAYPVIDEILYHSFHGGCDNPRVTVDMLSGIEPWGRWSDGPQAKLHIAGFKDQSVTVRLRVQPYSPQGPQRMLVKVNGADYGVGAVGAPSTVTFYVQRKLNAGDTIDVDFSFPDRKSPAGVGESSDQRSLAIGFIDMEVSPGAPANAPRTVTVQPYAP